MSLYRNNTQKAPRLLRFGVRRRMRLSTVNISRGRVIAAKTAVSLSFLLYNGYKYNVLSERFS